jgi:hypothetical protein
MEIHEEKEVLTEYDSDIEETTDENTEEVEEVMVFMFSARDTKTIKVMKFKGEIKKPPICALLDSGSTFSFVNPIIIKGPFGKLRNNFGRVVILEE